MFLNIINIFILLFIPFLFVGLINKTKAFWGGKKGASVLQPYYDFFRLLKKGQVISNTSSFIFLIFPTLSFASLLVAGILIPMVASKPLINLDAGFIVFAYILAFGKFFLLIGAMDTGSSFEGMGASREASFSTMIEPAFFITMASIASFTGVFSFESISLILKGSSETGMLIIILTVIVFFIMMLIEAGRVPIDDPDTHLELTMIHEVIILDNSGFDLAILTYSSGIKMLIFSSLIASLLIPSGISYILSYIFYFFIIFISASLVGTIEASFARLRMTRIFEFIFFLSSLSLIIFSLTAIKFSGN